MILLITVGLVLSFILLIIHVVSQSEPPVIGLIALVCLGITFAMWVSEKKFVTRITPKIEIATEVRDSTVVAVDTIYTFTFKLTD